MLKRRELILLQSANAFGGTANALVMIAIPWLILERTDSPALAGVAAAAASLPGIVVAPFVGTIVDRIGRRAVSVGADLCSVASVLLFPLLDALGLLGYGAVLALTVLGAVFDPAGYTARKALIPDVAEASAVSRDSANGIHEGVFATGFVAGLMAGAFCIAAVGSVAAIGLAAVAFGIAVVSVAAMRVPNLAVESDPEPGSTWSQTKDGLRALRSDRAVWLVTLLVTLIAAIYMPTESVLLPVHFESLDEPGAYGLVLSALVGGVVVGAFGYGWLARRMSLHRMVVVFVALTAIAYVPIAFLPSAAGMLVPAFLLGLAWGPMEPLLNTLVQERFPARLHGRIYGFQLALFYAAPPLGQLLAGVAVERYGVQPVLFVVAAGLLGCGVLAGLIPALRDLDAQRARAAVEGAVAE